ncbi:hypothetical protein CC2G_013674 [Coprinopsis cinerea AmutBmut pab1-1]|nr:hypothetical protein CC2G_013674 [Coprinopsis cinerea AmutBmut pab1-1]
MSGFTCTGAIGYPLVARKRVEAPQELHPRRSAGGGREACQGKRYFNNVTLGYSESPDFRTPNRHPLINQRHCFPFPSSHLTSPLNRQLICGTTNLSDSEISILHCRIGSDADLKAHRARALDSESITGASKT